MNEWDSDEAINALKMERTVNPSETEEELARRIIRENLPAAASAIAHLAIHSPSEKTRLEAARYIVDRNLGKIGDERTFGDKDPWDELLADCVKTVNAAD